MRHIMDEFIRVALATLTSKMSLHHDSDEIFLLKKGSDNVL